jgi:hypothetical protein
METENNHVEESTKPETATVSHEAGQSGPKKARRLGRRKVTALVVLLLLVVLALFWSWWLFGRNTNYNEDKAINTNQFQAVFLTNGQVYFGKLTDLNHKYVTLTDIYYLQVQSTNGSLQNASGNASSNSQVSLAKLGSELHGPEDKMSISSDQVLFWENLKNDSKVSQAISKYQIQ